MKASVSKLIRMYEEGLSLRKIEKTTGVPRENVRRMVNMRVEMRHKPITYHEPRRVFMKT